MSHALIVGGTGMLSPVTNWLSDHYDRVSVLARSLQEQVLPEVNSIAVDYFETDRFLDALDRAQADFGPFDMVVGWFHHIKPALALGEHLTQDFRFLHIVGSAAGNPEIDFEERIMPLRQASHANYQLVVLGFQLEDDKARWLTHDEICAGVLEAEKSGDPTHVIGTLTPWDRRPQ